jgi:hypothetical protein
MPHKKGGKRKTLRVKKGGYYGFSGALGTGAPAWSRSSEMGDYSISSRGGNTQYGRGRKRKGKGKKTRRMKGGGSFGAVSASYQGTGSRGLADVVGVTTKYPAPGGAAGGGFNNFGAQPGSGHGSFITTSK